MSFSRKMFWVSMVGLTFVLVAIMLGLPLLSFIAGNVFGFCGVQSFMTRNWG